MRFSEPFAKDPIAVVEKQLDRLRKEVDDRMSSNHTLWRAGLAGIGAFILLKEAIDLNRVVLALPILCMGLAAHWLNQLLTLYRSGDAMAACEARVNELAGCTLLDHELILTRMRRQMLIERRALVLIGAVAATATYWIVMWQVQPLASDGTGLMLWRIGLAGAALVNFVAAVNLRRFLGFSWPALSAIENRSQGVRSAA